MNKATKIVLDYLIYNETHKDDDLDDYEDYGEDQDPIDDDFDITNDPDFDPIDFDEENYDPNDYNPYE